MAYMATKVCNMCGKQFNAFLPLYRDNDNICLNCKDWEENNNKQKALAALKKLSIEERLEIIEEILYDIEKKSYTFD